MNALTLRILPDPMNRLRDPFWLRGIQAGRAGERERYEAELRASGHAAEADKMAMKAAAIRSGRE